MKSGRVAIATAMALCCISAPAWAQVLDIQTKPTFIPALPAPDDIDLTNVGPAPKPSGAWPTDPKARKAIRKQRQQHETGCAIKYAKYATPAPIAAQAVKACDALLALPMDPDMRWDSRPIWLQLRAYHQVMAKGYDGALISLLEADEIGYARKDPLFDGGLAVGNAMLRAYAKGKSGKRAEALAEIDRVRSARPHSTSVSRSLDLIAANAGSDGLMLVDSAYANIKWQPNNMRWLLPMFIARGDYQRAGDILDDISTINPKMIGGWSSDEDSVPAVKLENDVEVQMQRAYVASVLDQLEKSDAIIEEAQQMIRDFIGQRPVVEAGRKPSKSKINEYETRVIQGDRVSEIVRQWQRAIELRSSVRETSPEAIMIAVETEPFGRAALSVLDIIRNMKLDNPADRAELDKIIREGEANNSRKMVEITPEQLRGMLPDAEFLNSVPSFSRAGDGILFGRENGYSQAKEKDSDIRTIRFGTTSGSFATAEELSLLAAADYAVREGKDSFILLARRAIERKTTVYGWYGGGSTYDSGHESQLRLVLLDSNNLPPEWQGKKHRLIMANQIIADIRPRYEAIEARKAAGKAKK